MRAYLLSFLMLLGIGRLLAQDVQAIIRESEERRRGVESSYSEMTMTIVRPKWQREMSIKSWGKGQDYALLLITAPEAEKGTVTLKREKEVWNWLPKIGRTIKLPRSMMSQSWNGSDFTNDDLVREVSLIDDYEHTLLGDSTIQGRTCWKIQLIPHEDVAVVWGKIIMFVDQQDYLQLRVEEYDEDGYLINIISSSGIKNMDGIPFATRMELVPVEEEGQMTILEYQTIQFNVSLQDAFFSIQNMKRVR